MTKPTTMLLVGAGRMGRAILDAGHADPTVQLAGVVVRSAPADAVPVGVPCFPDLASALAAAPEAVVLDFAVAEGAGDRLAAAAAAGHPFVLGTTGLGAEVEAALASAAGRVPVVVAPNTSPGVALLVRALRAMGAAAELGWDAGIVDRHHRVKRDAPSGTARLLERELRGVGNARVEVVSLRQGGVIGEHAVHLSGEDEEILLVHRAFSRRAFARGALLAAKFAASSPPGRYGMDDVLA